MVRFIFICLMTLATSSPILAADGPHVLIVIGPTDHAPGTHEVAASARLLAHCLEHAENVSGIKTTVTNTWPEKALRDEADTIVFTGDTFPPQRMGETPQKLADLQEMMDRGCGIVCIHYATGLLGKDVNATRGDHPLLRWMGGYFGNKTCEHHQGIARVFKSATITPTEVHHPINRGWSEFTLHDEPYLNSYFGPHDNQPASNVTILATSMLPPEAPSPEKVAWCIQRTDGGRGFAIVMPHFYRNWADDDLRTFILNGIVWSTQAEIPEQGVQTPKPDLSLFHPDAIEQPPKP